MQRIGGTLATVIALLLVFVAAWDFVAPVRKVPQLAPADSRATSILVEKKARRLTLFHGESFPIALSGRPVGPKEQEGDGRTPESDYTSARTGAATFISPCASPMLMPISHPDADDRSRVDTHGVPPGVDIMIHGLPNGLGWLGAGTCCETGQTDALPSPTRRSRKSGRWSIPAL